MTEAMNTWRLSLAALAFTAVFCAANAETIRIGHAAPTSAGGGLAEHAKDSERGARMAIDEWNEKGLQIGGATIQLELLAQDDRANPTVAKDVARHLVSAKVVAVIGHLNSGPSIQASDVYADAGVSQITPAGTNPLFTRRGLKTSFRTIADDAHVMHELAKYVSQTLGLKRIAIIEVKDGYSPVISSPFSEGVLGTGASVIAHEYIPNGTTDFSVVLSKLKELDPDLIFFGGFDGAAAKLLLQMRVAGIKSALAGPDAMCSNELLRSSEGAAVERKTLCVEAGGVSDRQQIAFTQFKTAYTKRYGVPPLNYSKHAYDAANLLVDAMIRAQSSDPKAITRALSQTNEFMGVTGPISFDEKGDLKTGAVSVFTFEPAGRKLLSVVQ